MTISVPDEGTEKLVASIELKRRGHSDEDAMDKIVAVKRGVNSAISDPHGFAVTDLVVVAPGSIPITTSGKVRRRCASSSTGAGSSPAWTLSRSREFRVSTFGKAVERARVAVNPDAANSGGQQEDACRADDDGGSADCSPHSVMQLQHYRLGFLCTARYENPPPRNDQDDGCIRDKG